MNGKKGGGRGGGMFDPSSMHLKKELTQIKKAARLLRDPDTTSWRPPLDSARSAAGQHCYYHHQNDVEENSNVKPQSHLPLVVNGSTEIATKDRGKKVFLYNWRTHKSDSEKSRKDSNDRLQNGVQEVVEVASSTQELEEKVEDCLSDARYYGNDPRSDSFVSDNYASNLFKCKDTAFIPVRRSHRKKTKKNKYSNSVLRCQKLSHQHISGRGDKRALRALGRGDLSSLVDYSDNAEDCFNPMDLLWRFSADSPLLARLRNKKSDKLVRRGQQDDSSYSYGTPTLSTSSYNKHAVRYPGTLTSWDAMTGSFHDADDEEDDELDFLGRKGCGIPCYWSRRTTPKSRGGSGSYLSPSFSDVLRRKGSNILCKCGNMCKRGCHQSSLGYDKMKSSSRTAAQNCIPLLTNHGNCRLGSSVGTCNSDDEASMKFGMLEMEALSRLDGKGWSTSAWSQDGLEVVALNRGQEEASVEEEEEQEEEQEEEEGSPEIMRSLSQKYRPMFFEELVGQNIVVQSLMNAVSRKRIAPVYLFQGPHGTGKTSTSRVFAAALNCLVSEETKPCGICRECDDFISGESRNLTEVDGTDKKAIVGLQYFLKSILAGGSSSFSGYKIFVVNECHLLPAKIWMSFLKFLEEPVPHVIFILITTNLENLPHTVLSRCQKYLFNKIQDGDIVTRLKKIATEENIDVEVEALNLIAVNADGSLQDAESMLDQLSLIGKRITTYLVDELVGVVSNVKLLELLELSLSSNTAEVVKRAQELLDTGGDPITLMSQMATLIMDIIARSNSTDDKEQDSLFVWRNLTEAELQILKRALKLLSEAENQSRVSSERSRWFIATLLQLGSISCTDPTHSGSSRRQSSHTIEEENRSYQINDPEYAVRTSCSPMSLMKSGIRKSGSRVDSPCASAASSVCHPTQNELRYNDILPSLDVSRKNTSSHMNSDLLDDIWVRCVEKCHSKSLRQLLHTFGKLISLSEVEGVFVAYIAIRGEDMKSQAERFHNSISNLFETVLRSNVVVRIILLPDEETSTNSAKLEAFPTTVKSSNSTTWENTGTYHRKNGSSNPDSCHNARMVSRGSINDHEDCLLGTFDSSEANILISSAKEKMLEPPLRRIESIIQEQRLETAWLQALEKGTPRSPNPLRPERNQVLTQDDKYYHNQLESIKLMNVASHHWEDGLLIHDIEHLKIDNGKATQKNKMNGKADPCPMSPSLLHDNSTAGNFTKETSGYESGSAKHGCTGLLCWRNSQSRNRIKGTRVQSHRGAQLSWFGECAKVQRGESSFRR